MAKGQYDIDPYSEDVLGLQDFRQRDSLGLTLDPKHSTGRVLRRALLTLSEAQCKSVPVTGGRFMWQYYPTTVFKPMALFAFGPPDEILNLTIDHEVIVVDCPLRLLSTCYTMEDLERMCVNGTLRIGLLDVPNLTPSIPVTVMHTGKLERLVIFGHELVAWHPR